LHCGTRRLVGGGRHPGAEKYFAADRADAGISHATQSLCARHGGLPIVGDPDHVAAQIADLSKAGLTGIAISLVNYLDELPYFIDEVIGRLEHIGLRSKVAS
jgi:alkanesulfonate monooxygenase SsuD/methylene tetrahydromethanopterin reductase-like flavin-dependent oxidoreductase (luciferase family)